MESRDLSATQQQSVGLKTWQRRIGIMLIVLGGPCLAGKWVFNRLPTGDDEMVTSEGLRAAAKQLEGEHNTLALISAIIAGGIWLVTNSMSVMHRRVYSKAMLACCLAICVVVFWLAVRDSNAARMRGLHRASQEFWLSPFN